MAASVLFEKRPAHANTVQPEPMHSAVQSSSKPNQKSVWQRLKATATAPVEALDKVLFPDEPISFLRLDAAEKEPEPASTAASHSAPPASAAPPAAAKLAATLPGLATPALVEADAAAPARESSSPAPITDSSRCSTPAADNLSWSSASSQLASAVSAASDSLAARLAQLSSSLSPSWPAESAALGGVSALPAQLAGAENPTVSAELAKQLVQGGYALAALVVAVMTWQLAASVPAATKHVQATRPPADDAFAAHDDAGSTTVTPTTADASSAAPAAQVHAGTPEPQTLQAALPPQERQRGPNKPSAAQQQQQLLPVIELGPGDVLPSELVGKNVVGPFCLMRPSLGPASHGHFSAAVTAAAVATADALHAEGEAMRQVAAAPVAREQLDKPLHHMTTQEAAGKGQEVMQLALEAAAIAAAEGAEGSAPAVVAPAAEPEEQQEASPAVSVELTAVQPAGDEDDEPLFRVALKVCPDDGAARDVTPADAASSAAADSMEGMLAAEVVREALVAESCAAAAAAAAERAQIATHLIEDAIAAHSGPQHHTAADAGPTAAAAVSSTSTGANASEGSAVEAGSFTMSWGDEVSCSLAAEVRAAEVAAALATKHDGVVAQQDIPVTWQQPPAAAAAAAEPSSAALQVDGQLEKAGAAASAVAFVAGPEIPISWQQPAAGSVAEADMLQAADNVKQPDTDSGSNAIITQGTPAELHIPVSWVQPAALDEASVQQLVDEAKAAEAAAWEAEAARAAAAVAVARVAAAKAADASADGSAGVAIEVAADATATAAPAEQDLQQLVDEAKAAEAAAGQADEARAAAAAAVARVAAAQAAQVTSHSSAVAAALSPSTASTEQVEAGTEQLFTEAKAAEAAALEAEAVHAAAAARVAASKASWQHTRAAAFVQEADAEELVHEAKAAEAAALEAEEARTAAAAAVARVAASKAALAKAAAEAAAEAAAQERKGTAGPEDAAHAEEVAHAAAPAAVSGVALTRAAQAELVAEAIAAEAAAIATEAAAGAAEAAAAADLSAGQAAELVKGWVCGSTTGRAQAQDSNVAAAAAPEQAKSMDTGASSSSSTHGPPVNVSWVLDVSDSTALEQLTQLAAGLGHPAIGPIGGSSSNSGGGVGDVADESATGAQASGVVLEQAADSFAFLDEFGVPNDEPASFTSAQSAVAANAATATKQAPPTLADVLDVASQQQMQAASQTALQQAQARVVSLYRARNKAASSSDGQHKKGSPAARGPEASTQAAAPVGAVAQQSSRGLSALQQRLACQLGVSDVALALALAAIEGGELSPKAGGSSNGTARADTHPAAATGGEATPAVSSPASASKQAPGIAVLSSSDGDPYASAAKVISSNASTGAAQAPAADLAKESSSCAKAKPSTARNSTAQRPGVASSNRINRGAAVLRARQEQEVVIQGGDAESDSFEVAVQRMVINTARAKGRGAASRPAAPRGPAGTKASPAAPGSSKGPAHTISRAAAEVPAAAKGAMEIKITHADRAADSFEIAVQRMVSRAVANKGAKSSSSSTATVAAPTPTGVAPTAEQVIKDVHSSSSISDGSTSAPAAPSAIKERGVTIKITQPDMAADSFDVAVQRMVSATAAHNSAFDSSTKQQREAFSSAQTRQALGVRRKGFGRIITPAFKPQQPQARTGPAVVGRVPLYKRSPSPGRSLKSLPWWEQKAAARSAANGWEGFKTPATPAAATPATSPAASAAAQPTSVPVEWMETPTGQKRAELRERAGAILKQQQCALAPAADAAEAAAAGGAKAPNGPSSTSSGPQGLPSGWGRKAAARGTAAASKPGRWAALSAELTQELESEMSGLLASAAKPLDKELSAPYATPQIKVNGPPAAKPQPGRVVKDAPQDAAEQARVSKGGQGMQASKPPAKGDGGYISA